MSIVTMQGNGPGSSEPYSFPSISISEQIVTQDGDVHWGPPQRGELQIARDASFVFVEEQQRQGLLRGSLADSNLQVWLLPAK